MVNEKPIHRMTLRERLTHAEKRARDLLEQIHANLLPRLMDFRDLSRPVRRRSHYPTLLALLNALNKLEEGAEETQALANYLQENLNYIREHTLKEQGSRR
jgi:hypothetical protein